MREFEATFIVQPEVSEEGREALLAKIGGVLERGGATRLEVEDHGKRKLAYEIRRFQKGHYLTLSFLDEGRIVPELERAFRLEESVLRYLTVRVAEVVPDVEARRSHAEEKERIRREKAAERAAREAEEQAAREAEERATREAEAKVQESESESNGGEQPEEERSAEGDDDEEDRSS